MPGSVRSALLCLCRVLVAVLANGCGSTGSSGSSETSGSSGRSTASTQTAGTQTTAEAIAGHELSRLARALPVDAVRLPAASTKRVVETQYLTTVFDDAQTMWRREFAAADLSYKPAHLVVYWSKIESACGKTDDSGPFYCPSDRTVYLDLRFFTLLETKFGVRGVAQAYIVGHEVGHNVQRLLGVASRVDAANHADPNGRNHRSVLVELEADCLAGVWGRSAYARAQVTTEDLNDATRTAEGIGDDYLAEAAGNVVDSSLWTHGSSQQRQYWLRRGFYMGRPDACDTFAGG